jgi:hypothetical protein
MTRIPLAFRAFALLLVLAILPWSAAAEPLHRAGKPNPVGSSAGTPLSSLWSWLISLWEKNGCAIDPWGRCRVVPAKSGCMIDPGGRCLPGSTPAQPANAVNGCGIDPGGRCKG